MTIRYLLLSVAVFGIAGCGGSSPTQKAALVGWTIGHGGVVHLVDRTLEVKKLTDLPSGDFEVQKIDLTESSVTDADLENLAALPELQALTLHSTKISDEGLVHLQTLKGLKELDLTNTDISDAGLKTLAEIKSLEKLHLHNTAITNKALQEFHAALPSCQIFPAKR